MLDLASDTCNILSDLDPSSEIAIVNNTKDYMELARVSILIIIRSTSYVWKDIHTKLISHLDNLYDFSNTRNNLSSYDAHRNLEISSMKMMAFLEQLNKITDNDCL